MLDRHFWCLFCLLFTGIRHLPHVLTVPPTKAWLLCATPASMDLYIQAMPVGTYRVQSPGFLKIVYWQLRAFWSKWNDVLGGGGYTLQTDCPQTCWMLWSVRSLTLSIMLKPLPIVQRSLCQPHANNYSLRQTGSRILIWWFLSNLLESIVWRLVNVYFCLVRCSLYLCVFALMELHAWKDAINVS